MSKEIRLYKAVDSFDRSLSTFHVLYENNNPVSFVVTFWDEDDIKTPDEDVIEFFDLCGNREVRELHRMLNPELKRTIKIEE